MPGPWSLGIRAFGVVALIACLTAASFAAPAPRREGEFNTSAPTAILIDAESGTVLFERNADELVPPASLSKLMTQEVVFNELAQGRLKLDDEFLVSTNAWRTGGAPSRTSSMFAPINSRVRVEDLLRGVDRAVRQRRLHRARRRHRAQRRQVRRTDDQARPRASG